MTLNKMEKTKYQIGDHVPLSPFVIRGIAPRNDQTYLYFVQVLGSDNCFVATLDDLDSAIAIVYDKVTKAAFR
jgi:hypothetical protein